MNTRIIAIAAALALSCLAQAQTQMVYTLDAHGICNSPNGSYCYSYSTGSGVWQPFEAPQPEPIYYPSVAANYTTGLDLKPTYPRGGPFPVASQKASGSGTFNWSDGGGNSGTITIPELTCEFNGTFPNYCVSCSGIDESTGNAVTVTHYVSLFLATSRAGAWWNWSDHHGTMDISVTLP